MQNFLKKIGNKEIKYFSEEIYYIFIDNSKESIKILLELVSIYSYIARYTVNIQKSIVLLYISNEQLGFDIGKCTIHKHQKIKT